MLLVEFPSNATKRLSCHSSSKHTALFWWMKVNFGGTVSYDKRDDYNFHTTTFPFLSSNIPSSPAYGVFMSAHMVWQFKGTFNSLLRKIYMVDMGISSNIMKSPSPKCYMKFWDMTIYSDTLHWSDISLNRYLVTELGLITDFYVISKFREVSIEHFYGCG